MTDDARDALYARVFATPAGKLLLEDMDEDAHDPLVAAIRARIARMRVRWRTGEA